MTRWQKLEAWIVSEEIDHFTNADVVRAFGIDAEEATTMIRAYLTAQRGARTTTAFLLHREGRTTMTVWRIGVRTADAKAIGRTLFSDVDVKIRRAFEPDLQKLAHDNPRAARYAEAKIEAVVEGALRVLAAAVDSVGDDDE